MKNKLLISGKQARVYCFWQIDTKSYAAHGFKPYIIGFIWHMWYIDTSKKIKVYGNLGMNLETHQGMMTGVEHL